MEKPQTIETRIKDQEDRIRDQTLQALIDDLKQNVLSLEEVQKNEELFEIISELTELTQQKQDIRSALSNIPDVVEEKIQDINSRIIELNNKLKVTYPEILQYIEQRNLQYRNAFSSEN